ncbi:MAG: hypothetical protein IK000_00375, partial [Bacteroidaceae bacterium]|nr:hypothetical protein [Bacteroidaceae bacterium]
KRNRVLIRTQPGFKKKKRRRRFFKKELQDKKSIHIPLRLNTLSQEQGRSESRFALTSFR